MLRLFGWLKWGLSSFLICCISFTLISFIWSPLSHLPRDFWPHAEILSTVLWPGNKPVVYVGASNIGDLAVDDVRSFYSFPSRRVHNWTRGAMRVPEIETLVTYLGEQLPSSALRETVVVVGIWYGTFVLVRPVGEAGRDWPAVQLPFQAGRALLNAGRTWWLSSLKAQVYSRVAPSRDCGRPYEAPRLTRQEALAKFADAYERVDTAQIDRFVSAMENLSKAGAKILLVDMPLPHWHVEGSEMAKHYMSVKRSMLSRLEVRGIGYLDLTGLDDESLFRDATHPKPCTLVQWSEAIASAVDKIAR